MDRIRAELSALSPRSPLMRFVLGCLWDVLRGRS